MLRLCTLLETHRAGRTETSAVAMIRGKPILTVEVACGKNPLLFATKLVGGHRAMTTVVISLDLLLACCGHYKRTTDGALTVSFNLHLAHIRM